MGIYIRADGFETAEVSSGAVLAAKQEILEWGGDPDTFDYKTLAMIGMPTHFYTWKLAAHESGLYVASSLST